jgi:hypothetical protein
VLPRITGKLCERYPAMKRIALRLGLLVVLLAPAVGCVVYDDRGYSGGGYYRGGGHHGHHHHHNHGWRGHR